jgi:hypothetical protein
MTHKIQISKRLPDGTILVIGADTPDEFKNIVGEMIGYSTPGAEHVLSMFRTFAEAGGEIQVPVTETRPLMLGEVRPVRRTRGTTPPGYAPGGDGPW